MFARKEEIRTEYDDFRALIDARVEGLLDRRFGKFHMRRFNNFVAGRCLEKLRQFVNPIVAFLDPRAVIGDYDPDCFGTKQIDQSGIVLNPGTLIHVNLPFAI